MFTVEILPGGDINQYRRTFRLRTSASLNAEASAGEMEANERL